MCSCMHMPHLHRSSSKKAKSPVDPEVNGYILKQQDWLEADTWHVWKVYSPTDTSSVLSKIGVDLDGNRLCVFDANNKYDQTPAGKKLSLRDLMMGIWTKKHGKQPSDLRSVLIQSIVGEDVQKLRDEVYTMMGRPTTTDALFVRSDGATLEEREAFKMLRDKNPHGHGVKNMLDEYKGLQGKVIKAFVLEQPPYQSFQINIVIE
ncbi:hypothetical protein BJX64DRAFT_286386 [Aspergillus heterothallicus]